MIKIYKNHLIIVIYIFIQLFYAMIVSFFYHVMQKNNLIEVDVRQFEKNIVNGLFIFIGIIVLVEFIKLIKRKPLGKTAIKINKNKMMNTFALILMIAITLLASFEAVSTKELLLIILMVNSILISLYTVLAIIKKDGVDRNDLYFMSRKVSLDKISNYEILGEKMIIERSKKYVIVNVITRYKFSVGRKEQEEIVNRLNRAKSEHYL